MTVAPAPVELGGASLGMQLLLLLRVCPPKEERGRGERERGGGRKE